MARSSARSAADRSQAARIAAHCLHAKVDDPVAHTAPARRAFLDRFESEGDPEGTLEPADRARRAGHARKAYFARLALRSAAARRRKAGTRTATPPTAPIIATPEAGVRKRPNVSL